MKISERSSKNITNLNILLTIMIVFMHATNLKNYVFQDTLLSGLIFHFQKFMMNYILAVAVPGFFIISGFLFYNNIDDEKIFLKIKKRIKTLFIQYIVWNIVAYVYFFTTSNLFKGITSIAPINFNIYDFIEAIFLFKYSPVNWYLFQLLIYVGVSPLIYKILQRIKGTAFFIFILAFIILNINIPILNSYSFLPCLRVDGLFYYSLGAIFAIHFKKLDIFYKFTGYKSLCLGAVGLLILGVHYRINVNVFPFGIIFIFLFFRNIVLDTSLYKLSNLISPFMMYQTHEFILEPIEKIILLIFGNNYIYSLVDYFCAPLITILIIITLTHIVRSKFSVKLNLILWGGRV